MQHGLEAQRAQHGRRSGPSTQGCCVSCTLPPRVLSCAGPRPADTKCKLQGRLRHACTHRPTCARAATCRRGLVGRHICWLLLGRPQEGGAACVRRLCMRVCGIMGGGGLVMCGGRQQAERERARAGRSAAASERASAEQQQQQRNSRGPLPAFDGIAAALMLLLGALASAQGRWPPSHEGRWAAGHATRQGARQRGAGAAAASAKRQTSRALSYCG